MATELDVYAALVKANDFKLVHTCCREGKTNYQVWLPHGFTHAIEGVWGCPSNHEVMCCLDGANSVHATQIWCAILFKACYDW